MLYANAASSITPCTITFFHAIKVAYDWTLGTHIHTHTHTGTKKTKRRSKRLAIMLIVQSTKTELCLALVCGKESLMEMTCGILTYARAKDAIFVSGKKIVDMHRLP